MALSLPMLQKLTVSVYNASALYHQTIFEEKKKAFKDLTNEEQAKQLNFVVGFLKDQILLPSEAHERWMEQKREEGWVFGPIFSETNKVSPLLQPYDKLSPELQAKDALVLAILSPFYDV